MNKKTVVTVTGIRPDFIRMSSIFKKLDDTFNHILVHTGQHYDRLLSGVFFEELEIREPDYNLNIGGPEQSHYHQTGELSTKLIDLLKTFDKVDCVVFLGDSNSVCSAVQLKKEGYKIAHIEAGMRSYDKRMLEEINRTVCDICSNYLFVYHDNYVNKLKQENIYNNVYNVGNTIVEVVKDLNIDSNEKKRNEHIILDIHRPENFKYSKRLYNILDYANRCGEENNLPVLLLKFERTFKCLEKMNFFTHDFKNIKVVDLMSYKDYIYKQYHSKFIISDSGTAQEEPAVLNTPVIVPRDYTERPESVESGCSIMVNANETISTLDTMEFVNNFKPDTKWLGDGNTSSLIIKKLKELL